MKLLNKTYSEEALIKGCIDNDRKCQKALYMQYFDTMYRMCRKYLKQEDEILSVLNNGFLKVFQNIESFAGKGSFEGWIRRIVYHDMVEYLRGQNRYHQFIVFDKEHHAQPEKETPSGALDDLYYNDIIDLLSSIPPKAAEVFQLYAIEGYNHREIGEKLEMSENTSKWYLAKARQALKDELKKKSINKNIAG